MDKLEIQKSRFKKYAGVSQNFVITNSILEQIISTPTGNDVTIDGKSVTATMSLRALAIILQGRI